MSEQFKYLFEPIKIGNQIIKNRVVVPPHALQYREDWDRIAAYHVERAKGGVGMIVQAEVVADPSAKFRNMKPIYEEHLPQMKKVVDGVHEYGTKILCQIAHNGPNMSAFFSRKPLWAPSGIPSGFIKETPHAMEIREIKELQASYGRTASLIQQAGYDGIELQGAHGYMLYSWLSTFTNKRNDEYGGSVENRMRFVLEVIQSIRKEVGRDFILGIRLSGDELTPGGLDIEDMKDIACRFEDTGLLDYLSICFGNYYGLNPLLWYGDMSVPLGIGVPYASAIKEVTREIPIITAVRINDPVHADKILADGHADMVAMARANICDPEIINKAKEGKLENIRYCIGCNQGCVGRLMNKGDVECVQNPAAGREKLYGIGTLQKAIAPKKVMIIGGGPAGMKAAEIAAKRGHTVALYEKEDKLGGQVNLATKISSRSEFGGVTRYIEGQLNKLDVNIHLNTEVDEVLVEKEKPDVVILATGAYQDVPDHIPGTEQANVVSIMNALKNDVKIGERVVVVDMQQGNWECCSVAEDLAQKGKQVIFATTLMNIGDMLPALTMGNYYKRLAEHDVEMLEHTSLVSIEGNTVTFKENFSEKEKVYENVDTILINMYKKAENSLFKKLEDKVDEIYFIGDCNAPRLVDSAILEGETIARQI